MTKEELDKLFSYNKDTGELLWKVSKGSIKAGAVAGCTTNSKGYVQILINRKSYKAHRLIWVIMTGTEPVNQIDHIDHNRANNKWNNLREVTRKENMLNLTKKSHNTSGFTGVTYIKRNNKWAATIFYQGKRYHLDYYDDKEDAIKSRMLANIKYGFHPNHGE